MTHLSMEVLLTLREPGGEPGNAAAREHLQTCSQCRAEVERLHQRVARIRALPTLYPPRDRWRLIAAQVREERRRRVARVAGLVGLAMAASIALAVLVRRPMPPAQVASQVATAEIHQVMERSRALEDALSRYDPTTRVLDGRTAGMTQVLEDRIALVDRALERAELLQQQRREQRLLELWRERVGLLDALVDVHITRANYVGL